MHLNLAIQATAVYFDVVLGPDRKPEELARGKGQMNHPVPEVSLQVFLLYYPHWIRFREVRHGSRGTSIPATSWKRILLKEFDIAMPIRWAGVFNYYYHKVVGDKFMPFIFTFYDNTIDQKIMSVKLWLYLLAASLFR